VTLLPLPGTDRACSGFLKVVDQPRCVFRLCLPGRNAALAAALAIALHAQPPEPDAAGNDARLAELVRPPS
jgi:hypothetical protein